MIGFTAFAFNANAHLNNALLNNAERNTDGAPNAFSQTEADSAAPHTIKDLEFLVGDWVGPGVSYNDKGEVSEYYDTEFVRFDLDENLLLINARGEQDGRTTYQLHTVIYFDQERGQYVYTPYRGERAPRPFFCDLEAQKLICLTEAKTYRLVFQRLDDGRWNEYGEGLTDGIWVKRFETKLSPRL